MSTEQSKLALGRTLRGQLQRRRGAGYREALRRSGAEVEAMVFACVVEDPRWDPQLEGHHAYYAELLRHFEADLAPVERLLREDDPDEWGNRLGLAFGVLEELGRRGRQDAMAMLRRYVEYGRHWPQAVSALQDTGRAEAWRGLLGVLLERFPSGRELAELVTRLDADQPPTPAWRAACPPLDAAFREWSAAMALQPSREAQRRYYARLSLEQLFREAEPGSLGLMRPIVGRRVRPADRALLQSYLRLEAGTRCALALYGIAALGTRKDWEAFRAVVEASPDPPRYLWGHLVRAAEAFPACLSLPDAREWFGAVVPIRAHLARHVLAEHAEAQDLGRLLAAIPAALIRDEMYPVCSALEGIARLPAAGRLPAVERAFEEATYSWARGKAVEAMLVHAPEQFVRAYATECLWDAEPWLRILGCRHADRSLPEVRERLVELEADRHEDVDVREAAR